MVACVCGIGKGGGHNTQRETSQHATIIYKFRGQALGGRHLSGRAAAPRRTPNRPKAGGAAHGGAQPWASGWTTGRGQRTGGTKGNRKPPSSAAPDKIDFCDTSFKLLVY